MEEVESIYAKARGRRSEEGRKGLNCEREKKKKKRKKSFAFVNRKKETMLQNRLTF